MASKLIPASYDKTRNYLDGTGYVVEPVHHPWRNLAREPFADAVLRSTQEQRRVIGLLFELGWREFFHRTWQQAGNDIFNDMRHAQDRCA